MKQQGAPSRQEVEPAAVVVGSYKGVFGKLPRWRRTVMSAAMAGLLGGAVGGAVVAVFEQPLAVSSPPAATTSDVPALLAKVLPGVVSIRTRLADGAERAGTGMVISPDGEVLTNAHVVSAAASITVTRYGTGRALSARLVGASPEDDLALVQIDGQSDLPTVKLGASGDAGVGTFVVAVGDALADSATPTASGGIISAEGCSAVTDEGGRRLRLDNLFQTDAEINSDNSGGPLIGSGGRVIGINTAVAATGEDIGFAIPVDEAKDLLGQLRAGGTTGSPVPVLGIVGVNLSSAISDAYGLMATTGVLVSRVVSPSPAETAGLLRGDVVVAVDGAPITDGAQLRQMLAGAKVGEHLQLQVVRGSSNTTFTVTLGSRSLGAEAPSVF
jgi:serine protease Do